MHGLVSGKGVVTHPHLPRRPLVSHAEANPTPAARPLRVEQIGRPGWSPVHAAKTTGVSRATAYKGLGGGDPMALPG